MEKSAIKIAGADAREAKPSEWGWVWEGGCPLPRQEPQQFDHQNGAFWWILNCKSVVKLSIIYCFVLSIAEVLVLQKLKNPARYKIKQIHLQ